MSGGFAPLRQPSRVGYWLAWGLLLGVVVAMLVVAALAGGGPP